MAEGEAVDVLPMTGQIAGNQIVLALQNHSPIMASYKNVLDMVHEVGSEHLKQE